MFSRLLLVLVSMMAFVAWPKTGSARTFEMNPARSINIIDVVDSAILDEARKLEQLSRESDAPVDILVNSPGGSVMHGTIFMDAMKVAQARGVRIRCVTGIIAASMAFDIWAACDERYALPSAKLLFHPIRISMEGALIQEVESSFLLMQELEDKLMVRLDKVLAPMSEQDILTHYHGETLWDADILFKQALKLGRVVQNVTGTDLLFQHRRARGIMLFGVQIPGVHPVPVPAPTKDGAVTKPFIHKVIPKSVWDFLATLN